MDQTGMDGQFCGDLRKGISLESNVKDARQFTGLGREVVTAADEPQFNIARKLGGLVVRGSLGIYRL